MTLTNVLHHFPIESILVCHQSIKLQALVRLRHCCCHHGFITNVYMLILDRLTDFTCVWHKGNGFKTEVNVVKIADGFHLLGFLYAEPPVSSLQGGGWWTCHPCPQWRPPFPSCWYQQNKITWLSRDPLPLPFTARTDGKCPDWVTIAP